MTDQAVLALEDGSVFYGRSIGTAGETVGEVVFNTARSGYQEILPDPAYARQLVTLTYPHIGNTGCNPEDEESESPAAAGLIVRTRTEKIDRIRRTLLELLLAHAPDSPILQELAGEYGADRNRFEPETAFCIHCGLCVRYCAEVVGQHAVGFIDRGVRKEISFLPEIASRVCNDCKECFPLCPTSYLQAAYVLVEAFSSRG